MSIATPPETIRNAACAARMSDPRQVTLDTANVAEKIMEENLDRKRFIIENRGPGVVYISPVDRVAQFRGIRIANGGAFVEDPFFVHIFEMYAVADVDGTNLVITEWV